MRVCPRENAKREGRENRTALSVSVCIGVLCSLGVLYACWGIVCVGWHVCGGYCSSWGLVCVDVFVVLGGAVVGNCVVLAVCVCAGVL